MTPVTRFGPALVVVACLVSTSGAASLLVEQGRDEPRTAQPRDQGGRREPRTAQPRDRDDRREPQRRPPAPRPPYQAPAVRGHFVFIGGYFYDPFFGPYPWWPRRAFPAWYYPVFDYYSEVRVLAKPRATAVYVDGFYAGIVDDFDGAFQRLRLPPGGHRIALYLEGHRTFDQSIYLHPGSTFHLRHAMEILPAGEVSERPAVSASVPPPPDGTYTTPRTPRPPSAPTPPPNPAEVRAEGFGTLSLTVQPPTATVVVDGQSWVSSDAGRYVLQVSGGSHRVEVSAPGFRRYSTFVEVREMELTPLNVSLPMEGPR